MIAALGRTINMSTIGSRTSKQVILFMTLSTATMVLALYKAPEQLASVGVAIGAMGGGAAALKAGNGFEAKHSKNGNGDVTS